MKIIKIAQEITLEMVENPNCSPEILAKALLGDANDIAFGAAKNPNCPPEALAKVLDRGKDDMVSFLAAHNPRCPTKAWQLWVRKRK